jgi:hypothetical protein
MIFSPLSNIRAKQIFFINFTIFMRIVSPFVLFPGGISENITERNTYGRFY